MEVKAWWSLIFRTGNQGREQAGSDQMQVSQENGLHPEHHQDEDGQADGRSEKKITHPRAKGQPHS